MTTKQIPESLLLITYKEIHKLGTASKSILMRSEKTLANNLGALGEKVYKFS